MATARKFLKIFAIRRLEYTFKFSSSSGKTLDKRLNLHQPNRTIYLILVVGVVLGITDYFLSDNDLLIKALFLHTFTTFVIGYALVLIAYNKHWFFGDQSLLGQLILLCITFIGVGLVGTELEAIVETIFFSDQAYVPFSKGKIYLLNVLVANILGFTFYFLRKDTEGLRQETTTPHQVLPNAPPTLPIRKGDTTILKETAAITYFEAYDNYSYGYDQEGNKFLCEYSLGYLASKLGPDFIRIHRKHIVNKRKINSITKYFKNRYIIHFNDQPQTTLKSSASYAETVKSLMKL